MTIIDAIKDPNLFGSWFVGTTWQTWRAFLKVLFGLELDEDEALTYACHTQRETRPAAAFREAWVVVGRRGGKSLVASLVAVFLACFRDYSSYLKPGEVGTIAVIAADRRQARTILRYIRGFLAVPMLARLVANDTAESIELANGVVIEVHTASFRGTRGYTFLAVICDEIAFWRSDDSANPDTEILSAVRPGLATIPASLLLCISSPYARRGALWQAYQKHFAKDSSVLVWQADSRTMNPSLPNSVIEQAYEEDPASAAAEYGAEFRRDVETFISREVVECCTVPGRFEIPPTEGIRYHAFTDPSGGSSDSMTLAIAHRDGNKAVLDCIREVRPPFSPDSVVKEFAEVLKSYRITMVTGDKYAGLWPRERASVHGITYRVSDQTKSDIYLSTLPLLNSQRVELLDNARLIGQISALERRTSRSGRDSVDHGPGNVHDDLANSACGVLSMVAASKPAAIEPIPIVKASWPTPAVLMHGSALDDEEVKFIKEMSEGGRLKICRSH